MNTVELECKRNLEIGRNVHDPDVLGYPLDGKLYVEYLSQDMDGIFKSDKAWRAFCNGNFDREREGFYTEGTLKPATVKKWVEIGTGMEIASNVYTRVKSDLWVRCACKDIKIDWFYELSGCDELGYPTSVEFIAVATLKNPQ